MCVCVFAAYLIPKYLFCQESEDISPGPHNFKGPCEAECKFQGLGLGSGRGRWLSWEGWAWVLAR